MNKKYPYRSEKELCYHGRCGHPLIHLGAKTNREYIMVRKKDGGRKRLYLEAGNVPARLRGEKRKREPSAFNVCVGREMKGTKSKGRGDKSFYKKFIESIITCGGNVSDKTKKKWKIK